MKPATPKMIEAPEAYKRFETAMKHVLAVPTPSSKRESKSNANCPR